MSSLVDDLPLSLDDGRQLIGFEIGPPGDTSFLPTLATPRAVQIFLATLGDNREFLWWPVYAHSREASA
jgi:hypothetical protein